MAQIISSLAAGFCLALAAFMLDKPSILLILFAASMAAFASHEQSFGLVVRQACWYLGLGCYLLAFIILVFAL